MQQSSSNKESGLQSVLNRFLTQILDCRVIILSTLDGVEVMNASRDLNRADGHADDHAITNSFALSCSKTSEHVDKLELGGTQYSISWVESGILVRFKLDALAVSLMMEDNANMGLIEDHLNSLQRILKPFCTSNFVNHQV